MDNIDEAPQPSSDWITSSDGLQWRPLTYATVEEMTCGLGSDDPEVRKLRAQVEGAAADYGVTVEELERFLEKLSAQADEDAKAGRLIRYTGHLEDLFDPAEDS